MVKWSVVVALIFYSNFKQIYEWMVNLVKRFSNVATLVDGGMSSEGRHVLGVRIAFGKNLPIIYMDGGELRARDWLGPGLGPVRPALPP